MMGSAGQIGNLTGFKSMAQANDCPSVYINDVGYSSRGRTCRSGQLVYQDLQFRTQMRFTTTLSPTPQSLQ